jgi:hypothetical protein
MAGALQGHAEALRASRLQSDRAVLNMRFRPERTVL